MKTIVQIVPTLSPAIDGLGDYALNLARQLRRDFSWETTFIICNPAWKGTETLEGFPCHRISHRSTEEFCSILPMFCPILLHYSGYGYALRGCPTWLVAGLEKWRKQSRQLLATMFHEVYPYNFGPPWTSSFWLSPCQKQLAIRLLKLSDRVLTSRENYAKLLRQLSRDRHAEIPIVPVFSNIGEPETLLPWERREWVAIAFGHCNMRSRLYQHLLPQMTRVCQSLGIKNIYDIGVPTGLDLSSIADLNIMEKGILEAEEVSHWMRKAIAGFLSFPPPEYLGKSTIFAAYCAHELLPILFQSSPVPVDGLEAGKHYWSFDDKMEALSLEAGRAIAQRARVWYNEHSLPILAQAIEKSLTQ